MRTWWWACVVAVGCGGGGGDAKDLAASNGSSIVGTTGGAVTLSDGSGVSVPAGALTSPITLDVTPASNPPAPSGTVVGPEYTITPEGQQFGAAVTVTLAIDASKLPSGKHASDVVIVTAPVGSSTYTALTTTVVDATHVSAPTTHFSSFVPTVPLIPTECSTNADCMSGICVMGACAE